MKQDGIAFDARMAGERPLNRRASVFMPLAYAFTLALSLGYTALIAFGARRGFPESLTFAGAMPFLSDKPVGEDGYYLMLVAWNLGAGHGLVGNFDQTATGVQPLMTLLLAGVARLLQAAGFDKFTLARMVILLGGLLLCAFAALIARIARRLARDEAGLAPLIAFIAAATSFHLWRTFTYGLETGLYLTLLALTIERSLALAPGEPVPLRRSLELGFLMGLCGLARIDFGLVAAIVLVALLALRRIDLRAAAIMGATAFVVTLPWFVCVKILSGSWMPTSGPAQARLIDWDAAWGRGDAMIAAVAQNLAPFLPERGAPSLTAVGLALFFGALALARHRRSGALAPWVAGLGALPVVYYVFFWAAHFYPRYTAPLAIFGLLALALAAARLGRFRAPTAIGAVALLAGVNAAAAVADLHSGRIGDGHAVTAGYVARRLPPPAKVGAFQSGVTGYYNDNVVNLDGKINQDALEAMRDGRIEDYVERSGIQYVVDWEGVILGLMPNALPSGRWVRCAAAVGNLETICIRRADAPEP